MDADRSWSDKDVHEGLVRWGALAARMDDGGLGYRGSSMDLDALRQRPCRALEPFELMSHEVHALDTAVHQLEQPLRVVVLCYYKPGHMRTCWPSIGLDGKGRQRAPSTRAIAACLLVSRDIVEGRLKRARQCIANHLTTHARSSRIPALQ
jgi:hypothetical protein